MQPAHPRKSLWPAVTLMEGAEQKRRLSHVVLPLGYHTSFEAAKQGVRGPPKVGSPGANKTS
jgi:hypothetical protein